MTAVARETPLTATASLDDPDLGLPLPSFRRRPGTQSNTSSVVSQDLSGRTSEELWNLQQAAGVVDPDAYAPEVERPLDTIRRMSMRIEHSKSFHNGLPGDVICKSGLVAR